MAGATRGRPPIDNAAYLSTFPDVRAVTPVTMASASPDSSAPSDPIFRSLFQGGGERVQPVSPTVRALWGNSSSLTSVASTSSTQTPAVSTPHPLDLFSTRGGPFST